MSTETATEVPKYIGTTDLLDREWWTRAAIRKLLGEPDQIRVWTYYGRAGEHREYLLSRVEAAEETPEWDAHVERMVDQQHPECETLDILIATREASRAAHRWRDAAQAQYRSSNHGFAGRSKREKERMYRLKERGIVALHRAGHLRYIGASPQGMAVYEYGDGGMSCFHSTLHPDGAERTPVEGHPETLLVAAKKRRVRMMDVVHTLGALPYETEGYSRSSAPRMRRAVTCYECGEEGHIARECPDREYGDPFEGVWL